jgi:hypothetical protein
MPTNTNSAPDRHVDALVSLSSVSQASLQSNQQSAMVTYVGMVADQNPLIYDSPSGNVSAFVGTKTGEKQSIS